MKKRLASGVPKQATQVVADIINPPEETKPVPWTVEALGDDFSQDNIIAQLTDPRRYKYEKSGKELQMLFNVLGSEYESEYLKA